VTPLEDKLYVALLGARTIVTATANVNPKAMPVLRLVNEAAAAYKAQQVKERPPGAAEDFQEEEDAARNSA
jgi:hypothetical protein